MSGRKNQGDVKICDKERTMNLKALVQSTDIQECKVNIVVPSPVFITARAQRKL